jgi:hypothetical protein
LQAIEVQGADAELGVVSGSLKGDRGGVLWWLNVGGMMVQWR